LFPSVEWQMTHSSRLRSKAPVPSDLPASDLARLKWLDPNNVARFTRKEPARPKAANNEAVLENVLHLTDEIFGHLSVFEQFGETTSRGANSGARKKLACENERKGLLRAERELWRVYSSLRRTRERFLKEQLKSLGISGRSRGLKIHIGSAGYIIKDWINIDAGGADLALNVNWGLPFPDNSVSFVYCAHMLEHLRYNDQAPAFVRDILRVLAPGATARFVVPDLRKLLAAYANHDRDFFADRQKSYPLNNGFMNDGVANLDYVLLYSGAGSQALNYNHKFGYDCTTVCKLLLDAGFRRAIESQYQRSSHVELRVDDSSFDAQAERPGGSHFSVFVEANK
jgi:methyltransferase family protein